ncbi:MAG: hypothetical protein RIE58_00380 [Vicingaceae bacterium]
MNDTWTLRITGSIVGLAGPWLALWAYYKLNYASIGFKVFLDRLLYTSFFAPMLSLAVLINLLLFFSFLWLKRDNGAIGVLFATIVYAFVVFGFKLFGS